MSVSDPGKPQPGARPGAGSRQPEQGTDPGRAQPYESLYRNPSGQPGRTHRPTARHYEPSLTPPEDQEESGDTFHWLYRSDTEPVREQSGQPAPTASAGGSSEPAVIGSTQSFIPPSRGPVPAPDTTTSRRRTVLVVVLVLLLVVAAAAIVWSVGDGGRGSVTGVFGPSTSAGPQGRPTGSASGGLSPAGKASVSPPPSSSPTLGAAPTRSPGTNSPYPGAVVALPVAQAVAGCQAPASTDSAGHRVSYGPELLVDRDPATAWRCNGSGVGQTVVLSFAKGSRIAEVAMVNGYAKVDPKSGAKRYGEYRRIQNVTWTFPNGATFTQTLHDKVPDAQRLRIPVQTTDRVVLTITKTTSPGKKARSRDAALISELSFASPAS